MNTTLRILAAALGICVIGLISIYSSTLGNSASFWQSNVFRQLTWVMIGIAAYQFFSRFNYRRLWDWMYLVYGVTVFLLFLVFVLGIVRLGAQRWLNFAWFNFQPSEAAKLIVLIFLARYFSRKSVDTVFLKNRSLGIFKALLLPFFFVMLPVGFIVEQPDLGSGTIIMILFLCMLYLSNIKLRYLIGVLLCLLIAMPFAWHSMRPYQKQRVTVFMNPNADPLGAGYTVTQSKIAIGSGGFFGKGWLSGTQSQLHFLPESHTDFIFSTFSEEWGFFGDVLLLALYFLLINEGFKIAHATSDDFGKLLSLGVSILLLVQCSINVAMNLGLAPIVGIPLPLMSYGGSSVITTFIGLGILANINKTRAVF